MVLADTKDAVWVTEVEQLKSSNERVFYDVMYLIALAGFVDLVQTGFWDPRIRQGLCGMSVQSTRATQTLLSASLYAMAVRSRRGAKACGGEALAG